MLEKAVIWPKLRKLRVVSLYGHGGRIRRESGDLLPRPEPIEGRFHGVEYRLVSGDYLVWNPAKVLFTL